MLARLCLPTLSDFTHVVVVAESCCFLTMHISARTEFSQSLELEVHPSKSVLLNILPETASSSNTLDYLLQYAFTI